MATLKLSLRPGERIFVNGAVMRVDRKVSLELLNDATFLLESHVMQAAEASSPLRQIYFLVQTMLIAPDSAEAAADAFRKSYPLLMAAFANAEIRDGLMDVSAHVERQRPFEALRTLRALIPVEDAIMGGAPLPAPRRAVAGTAPAAAPRFAEARA